MGRTLGPVSEGTASSRRPVGNNKSARAGIAMSWLCTIASNRLFRASSAFASVPGVCTGAQGLHDLAGVTRTVPAREYGIDAVGVETGPRRDPTDNRARLVVTTARGRELVEISAPVVRRVEAAWAAHLGGTRATELRRTLELLREITDPFA